MPKNNERKLSLIWDKRQKDFVVKYPRRCDGMLILNTIIGDILKWSFEKESNYDKPAFDVFNLKEELENRGYDLSTMRFSIELKK